MGQYSTRQRSHRASGAVSDLRVLEMKDFAMPTVWVKWRLSPFEYSEITINDVLRDVR